MTTATTTSASSARAALQSARPLITIGATWAVRKGLIRGYEARTGKPAPVVYSRDASVASKVIWAATMAATIALIEAVLWQILDSVEDED
ncbi:MAG TPA: hypothetical protein VES03_10630 [Motilibacterales bacterium]|nr:hypothetical protein [Motilibacterales bacterium]